MLLLSWLKPKKRIIPDFDEQSDASTRNESDFEAELETTGHIFKGLRGSQKIVFKQEKVGELVDALKDNQDGATDLLDVRNTLASINAILVYWDGMKSSHSDDQAAYIQGRQAFLSMQCTIEEMLALSPSESKEPLFERLFSEADLICTKELFESEHKKAFLVFLFYLEYLDSLGRLCMDVESEKIRMLLVEAIQHDEELAERAEDSFYFEGEKNYDQMQRATEYVLTREERLESVSNKPKKKLEARELSSLLSQFKERSLKYLQNIIERPDYYLPIADARDLREVLLDVCYVSSEEKYAQIKAYPKAFQQLLDSFAFSHPVVHQYIAERYTLSAEDATARKQLLIMRIKQEIEALHKPQMPKMLGNLLSALRNPSQCIVPLTQPLDFYPKPSSVKIGR